MPLPADLRLRTAGPDDLPEIAAMRDAVGWGAHEWALRIASREPNGRMLLAVDGEGRIAGVGSGIAYGPLGFVGNMIVVEEHRRRGVGSAILSAVSDFLTGRGCTRLELFATPSGRPLYAGHGFEPMAPNSVARVDRKLPLDGDGALEVETAQDVTKLARYDAPRFGGDRHSVLAAMLDDPERPLLVARRSASIAGYAWLRAEDGRLGPFVADDPAVAATLIGAALERAPDAERLSFNLSSANAIGLEWLRSVGAELETWDGRMGRGPRIPRRDETIYGNAVGALG
jgi:GNAT superfamily N-acetyltransferase